MEQGELALAGSVASGIGAGIPEAIARGHGIDIG